MKLDNPFPIEVRKLFMDVWKCWNCGENGTRTGGLELHHILGRVSYSAFNAAPLCQRCHSHMRQGFDHAEPLFLKTVGHLYNIQYRPSDYDLNFIQTNAERLFNPEKLQLYLQNLSTPAERASL